MGKLVLTKKITLTGFDYKGSMSVKIPVREKTTFVVYFPNWPIM